MLEQGIPAGPHLEFIDTFLKRTVLRLIPYSVSPNSVTVVRFISIPVVIWLLLTHHYAWGAAAFALGVFTDALDGAMARTRNQITLWGKIADPLADKLLIGATAAILVTQYVNIWVAVLIIGIELLLVARAVFRYTYGHTAGANAAGKVKMVIQSAALLALFGFAVSGTALYLTAATWGFYVAIPSALASLFLAPAA